MNVEGMFLTSFHKVVEALREGAPKNVEGMFRETESHERERES